jgi:hypothetical protein
MARTSEDGLLERDNTVDKTLVTVEFGLKETGEFLNTVQEAIVEMARGIKLARKFSNLAVGFSEGEDQGFVLETDKHVHTLGNDSKLGGDWLTWVRHVKLKSEH